MRTVGKQGRGQFRLRLARDRGEAESDLKLSAKRARCRARRQPDKPAFAKNYILTAAPIIFED